MHTCGPAPRSAIRLHASSRLGQHYLWCKNSMKLNERLFFSNYSHSRTDGSGSLTFSLRETSLSWSFAHNL